jgi:dihydroxyacetone kinase-like protein
MRIVIGCKMKKLINSPENVVLESMSGLGAAFGDLVKIYFDPNYITRKDAPVKNKVALVLNKRSLAFE